MFQKRLLIRSFLLLIIASALVACTRGTSANPAFSPIILSEPVLPQPSPLSDQPAHWPTYRHTSLGVEVSYPPDWQVDGAQAFVWFNGPSGESFNVVNAGFSMWEPADFLNYLGTPILITETIVLDGQPALYVHLQPGSEAQGYRSVVAVITPDGRGLTIGNRSDPLIFEQALTTVRFFKPISPP